VDIDQRAAVFRLLQRNAYLRSPDAVGHRTCVYRTGAAAAVRTDSARRRAGNARRPVTSALRR
jgi:hypothetical protein